MTENMIRVLIADDHPVVRQGLRLFITTRYGMKVVAEAENGAEAVEKTNQFQPDVILMDLVMPGKSGVEAIQDIIKATPGAKILVLTSFTTSENISEALKAGAQGVLFKDANPKELISAIRDVAAGKMVMRKETLQLVRNDLLEKKNILIDELTEREKEILFFLAGGFSNKQIASKLSL